MLAVLAEQVAHGEVVQFQTDTSDDTRLSPTERELNLVVRLTHQVPVDVHRSVLVVRLHVGSHLLGVEVSHRSQFTGRTRQGFLVEEVARLGAQFAAHHILVETVVTIDAHAADVCLLSLADTHLQVNGVAHDVDFGRVQLIEQITIVPVEVAHGIVVFGESLVHQLLVVDVAFPHAEDIAQTRSVAHSIGRIYGVAHPRDVTDVVFLSLVHLNIYINVLGVVGPHRIFHDNGIAITQLVVFVDEVILVGLVALGRVLLRLEDIAELSGLVGLRQGSLGEERTFYAFVRQVVVAVDDDIADFNLFLLVDGHVEDHIVLLARVIALHDRDVGILIAFIVEVFLCQDLGAVDHVGRNLVAFQQTQLLLHVLTLRLLQSNIVDVAHSGAHRQVDMQIHLVANQRVGCDGHVREQSVLPIALHGLGDFCAGQFDFIANGKSGYSGQHIVLVSLDTRNVQSGDGAGARRTGIGDVGIDDFFLGSDAAE